MNDPSRLYVSDDPEFFPQPGVLFRARLHGNGSVARILFDHVNSTASPMRLLVGIANLDDGDGTIGVLGAYAGPGGDFMSVGHDATEGFLRAHELGHGGPVATLPIPKRTTAVLTNFPPLQPGPPPRPTKKRAGQCVAGIVDIELRDDHQYEVRVLACSPLQGMEVFDTIGDAKTDGVFRRGVYDIEKAIRSEPDPEIELGGPEVKIGSDLDADDETYPRVPGLDPYVAASQKAKPPRMVHKGEFGVLKWFTTTVPAGSTVRLVQSAHGGNATATYAIDGKLLLRSSLLQPADGNSDVVVLAAPADQARTVEIATMADINSMEPLHLAVVPDDSGAADGALGPKITHA